MLCLKKRRTYSFTQDARATISKRSKKDNNHERSLNTTITTLPRKNRNREERPSRMVLTVTEDTPADMLTGSMELLVQLPRNHHLHTQKITVLRSTPMMDLLVQIATTHKLTASSYTLQAIGERGLILPHHPNTPIGTLDALQVKLLPKQGTFISHKTKQANQPFETTFRLQVHLPRNQLYVSRVSPKMNLGEILDEVCHEKNLDRNKYELRHPVNLEEILDLSLSLHDYHLQEVTLYAKQTRNLGPTLSTQDIMALQRQEERRRQQTKQSVFGFMFKKSKENSLSTDSLGTRSVSPARSDETARSISPVQLPTRPQRKRRPAPKPPINVPQTIEDTSGDSHKNNMTINHSRNSSDSSGYHEASVLSDNPDSIARLPETLPRRSKTLGLSDVPRKLAQTLQSSKSLGNLTETVETLNRGISSSSLSSTGLRKKRAAPLPPTPRPLSSAISTQALERIVDSEESLTSDMEPSKPPSDIGVPSKINSDIDCLKVNSNVSIRTQSMCQLDHKPKSEIAYESNCNVQQHCTAETNTETRSKEFISSELVKTEVIAPVEAALKIEQARVTTKRVGESAPLPKPRKINVSRISPSESLKTSKHKVTPPLAPPRTLSMKRNNANVLLHERMNEACCSTSIINEKFSLDEYGNTTFESDGTCSKSKDNCTVFNKAQISQQEKISETIDHITVKNDLSVLTSNQYPNHKVENNFDLQNSTELIRVKSEDSQSKTEDKFPSEDKFNQEKRIELDIINDVKNQLNKSLNLNLHLSNKEPTALNSIQFNASPVKLLLSDCNIISKKNENNLEQDHEIKFENINLRIKNKTQHDNSWTTLDDSSLSENVIKLKRIMSEPKSEQLKHHQFACQRSLNAQKQLISFREIEENIDVVNPKNAMCGTAKKNDPEKETCTVISTIPKCKHLDAIREDDTLNNMAKSTIVENIDKFCENRQNYQNKESNGARNAKRTRVVRSQSKSDDFEMDTLKKQRRYLSLPPEDIAHALNFNFPAQNSISSNIAEKSQEQIARHCTDRVGNTNIDKGESHSELITAVYQVIPSETDILLQKVSDTLSNVLSTSSSLSESSLPFENYTTTTQTNVAAILSGSAIKLESAVETKDESNELYKLCNDFSVENTLNASTSNIAMTNSQQDTSDYVSAMGEDLSISDWEYQLPAPPSAFRDSHSLTFDDCDTVTLESAEVFKETVANPVAELTDTIDSSNKNSESMKNLSNNVEMYYDQKVSSEKMDVSKIDIKQMMSKPVVKQTVTTSQSDTNLDLRKEIISELENKIETGILVSTNKDFDRRNIDILSAPKLAPVDNTLSNFTITTYTKQKSLDIFEELEESSDCARNSEERFIKTFATLSRNNADLCNYDKRNATKNIHLVNNLSYNKKITSKSEKPNTSNTDYKMELKIRDQDQLPYKWQSFNTVNDKTNIQRSKSYISISNNKYQKEEINARKHKPQSESEITGIKKATSITDLNVDTLKSNEKFSQWRDNILKNQEEPTKEKLQSLQVLKSILPQLKISQQAEENVSQDYNNTLSIQRTNKYETEFNEHSVRMNIVSTRESRESECKPLLQKESTKRYVYSGPPAISLSSWSERSGINVQVKMDSDYKERSNTSDNKTIVSVNDTRNKKDIANYSSNTGKINIAKHESNIDSLANKNTDELIAKKLITHTTASNFKIANRAKTFDLMKNENRPVVLELELKRTSDKTPREMLRNEENHEIDTTPMNFKELTKTFSQYTNFKQKPKRININKFSDNCNAQSNDLERIANVNDYAWFAKITNQNDFKTFKNQPELHDIQQNSRAKMFTSIIGVNGTRQNFGLQSEMPLKCNNAVKINPPMPVVKGFKLLTANHSKTNNNQITHNELSTIDDFNKNIQSSKSPTMPVITGVTLKNANIKPKLMPVQSNPRDMLLESIRNFGGREKLKSTTGRY